MPVQGWYLDDETYQRLQEEASMQARKPGKILSEIVRVELGKRASAETRPKVCGRCESILEWHLTPHHDAHLYAVCPVCDWRFDTKEVYRTNFLH